MALNAVFTADVVQFTKAIQKAAGDVRAFDTETTKAITRVEATTGGLGSAFKALGPLLPVASFAAATSALKGLAESALESAGRITDLAHKTGLTMDTIQRMEHVASQTGTSVEAFTQASFKMGATIADGGTKAQQAIKDLGLSFDAIKRMSPDQQFAAVVKGLEGIDSQQERNRIGIAIFGRQFSEIAAAVGEGYTQMAEGAAVATDAQLVALDRAADAWTAFKDHASKQIQAFLGTAITAMADLERGADKLSLGEKAWMLLTRGASDYADQLREIGRLEAERATARTKDIELPSAPPAKDIVDYTVALREATREVRELDTAQRTQLNAALKLGGESAKDYAESIGLSDAALRLYGASLRSSGTSVKQHTKEVDGAQKTLAKFHQEVIELGRDASGSFGLDLMLGSGALGKLETKLSDSEEAFDKAHQAMMEMGRDASGTFGMDIMLASGALGKLDTQLAGIASKGGGGFFSKLFGGLKGGLQDVWQGMSGGGGFAGLLSNIGGGIISGGLNKLMDFGLSKAWEGLSKLFGGVSEEVTKAREEVAKFHEEMNDTATDAQRAEAQMSGWGNEGALTFIQLRDAIANIGGNAADADRIMRDLLDTDHPDRARRAMEEYNRVVRESARRTREVEQAQRDLADAQRELTRLQEQARYTLDEMQDDARTLGINFDRLGGVFAHARIDDTAERYTQALTRMIDASGNPGEILYQSREALSRLVQDAIAAGTTLPENMRPWINELRRAHLLVDQNGEELEGLDDLQFGEGIETEAETIANAMEELNHTIETLSETIRNMPPWPAPPPNYSTTRPPPTAPDYGGAQAYGGDYLVRKPTMFLAGENGPERATFKPAGMASGGETVQVSVMLPDGGRSLVDFVMRKAGGRWALAAG